MINFTEFAGYAKIYSFLWLIHNYDGWEEIWYADQRTEDNQILPQAVPAGVGSYRYGEIEEKKYELLAKIYGEEEDKEEDEEDEE